MLRFLVIIIGACLTASALSNDRSARLATTIFGGGAIPGFQSCEFAFAAFQKEGVRTAGITDPEGQFGVAMRDFDQVATLFVMGTTNLTGNYVSSYELTLEFCREGADESCKASPQIKMRWSSPMMSDEHWASMERTDTFEQDDPKTKVTFGKFLSEEDTMSTQDLLKGIELDIYRELAKNASYVPGPQKDLHWNIFKCSQYALGEVIAEK